MPEDDVSGVGEILGVFDELGGFVDCEAVLSGGVAGWSDVSE